MNEYEQEITTLKNESIEIEKKVNDFLEAITTLTEVREKLFPITQRLILHPIKVNPSFCETSCSSERTKLFESLLSLSCQTFRQFDTFFTDLNGIFLSLEKRLKILIGISEAVTELHKEYHVQRQHYEKILTTLQTSTQANQSTLHKLIDEKTVTKQKYNTISKELKELLLKVQYEVIDQPVSEFLTLFSRLETFVKNLNKCLEDTKPTLKKFKLTVSLLGVDDRLQDAERCANSSFTLLKEIATNTTSFSQATPPPPTTTTTLSSSLPTDELRLSVSAPHPLSTSLLKSPSSTSKNQNVSSQKNVVVASVATELSPNAKQTPQPSLQQSKGPPLSTNTPKVQWLPVRVRHSSPNLNNSSSSTPPTPPSTSTATSLPTLISTGSTSTSGPPPTTTTTTTLLVSTIQTPTTSSSPIPIPTSVNTTTSVPIFIIPKTSTPASSPSSSPPLSPSSSSSSSSTTKITTTTTTTTTTVTTKPNTSTIVTTTSETISHPQSNTPSLPLTKSNKIESTPEKLTSSTQLYGEPLSSPPMDIPKQMSPHNPPNDFQPSQDITSITTNDTARKWKEGRRSKHSSLPIVATKEKNAFDTVEKALNSEVEQQQAISENQKERALTNIRSSGHTRTRLTKSKKSRTHRSSPRPDRTHNRIEDTRILVKQLVISERDYVHQLGAAVNVYMQGLSKQTDIISKHGAEDFKVIFGNIEDLLKIHTEIWTELENVASSWPQELLGPVFFLRSEKLKHMYQTYFRNFPKASFLLEDCRKKSKKLNTFLQNQIIKSGVSDLADLLKHPLTARVEQYNIFLQNLQEKLPLKHPQYQSVTEALQKIEPTVNALRDHLDEIRSQIRLNASIFLNLEEPLFIPGRKFIRQTSLTLVWDSTLSSIGVPLSNRREKVADTLFLFSDSILYCTKRETKYKIGGRILLHKITLKEPEKKSEKMTSFQIIEDYNIGDKRVFTLIAEDPEDRDVWWTDLTQLLKKLEGERKVFGTPLRVLAQREKDLDIPSVLHTCCQFLMEHGLTVEGIFRKSGLQTEIENIKDQFDSGKLVEFTKSTNPHDVAAVLKAWLRELPNPLLTVELYDEWMRLKGLAKNDQARVPIIKELLNKLPLEHKYATQQLFLLLYYIHKHSDKNLMTASNLAIVIGPNLLRDPHENSTEMIFRLNSNALEVVTQLTEQLILQYELFFDDIAKERAFLFTARLKKRERDKKEEELKIQTYQSMEIKKKPQEPTVPALEATVKEGWLKKKGERRTNWTTRWFVLKYKTLTYFKNPRDIKPKGRIVLQCCNVNPDNRKPNCFALSTARRTYYIQAANGPEMEEWIKAIRSCIAESVTADLESGSEGTLSDDGEEEDIETSSPSKAPSSLSNKQTPTPTSTTSPPTNKTSLSSSKSKIQKK